MTTEAVRSHGTMLALGDGGVAGTPIDIDATEADSHDTLVKTTDAHNLIDGQPVTIAGVTGDGATAVNGSWTVKFVGAHMFTIPVATTAGGSGGTVTPLTESVTVVAEVGDIKGPNESATKTDVTTHDSPGGYEQFLMTLKTGGQVTFPINLIPSNAAHQALQAAFEDEGLHHWQMTMPDDEEDPTVLSFAGSVANLNLNAPVHGVLTRDVTLEVSGAPVWSYAGS